MRRFYRFNWRIRSYDRRSGCLVASRAQPGRLRRKIQLRSGYYVRELRFAVGAFRATHHLRHCRPAVGGWRALHDCGSFQSGSDAPPAYADDAHRLDLVAPPRWCDPKSSVLAKETIAGNQSSTLGVTVTGFHSRRYLLRYIRYF